MPLKVVDKAGFQALLDEGRSVVVDFYADWCHPCHALAPEVEALAEQHAADVAVVKVDVDAEPAFAQELGILGIPTVIRFSAAGEELARSVGTVPAGELASRLGLNGAA